MSSTNYKIVHTGVGPWKQNDIVSAKQIGDVAGLGGVDRLQRLGGIQETDAEPTVSSLPGPARVDPSVTKGDNVEPGSGDTVEKRVERRAEAVGPANTGAPGGADGASGNAGSGSAGTGPQDYNALTVEELRGLAAERDIEGRSELTTKAQLVSALKKTDRR